MQSGRRGSSGGLEKGGDDEVVRLFPRVDVWSEVVARHPRHALDLQHQLRWQRLALLEPFRNRLLCAADLTRQRRLSACALNSLLQGNSRWRG